MTTLLFGALWAHIAMCAFLVGTFAMLLLAGPPMTDPVRRWEHQALAAGRWAALAALVSGLAVAAVQTAVFEGRPAAALDPNAIVHALLETRAGSIMIARLGLLLVLTAVLYLIPERTGRSDWRAARGQALLLCVPALVLHGAAGHLAAASESIWPRAIDMAHLLWAGLWAGALPSLALLMFDGSRAAIPDPQTIRTLRRFSLFALPTMLGLAASGIASAWTLDQDVPGLVGTAHGQFLLGKVGVLLAALALAGASRARLGRLGDAATARRVAWFVAVEAALAPVLIGLAMAMAVTTPGRHVDPVWPLPVRISLNVVSATSLTRRTTALIAIGCMASVLAVALLLRHRARLAVALSAALVVSGSALALRPSVKAAHPKSFAHSPLSYDVTTIAAGQRVYAARCAACHQGAPPGPVDGSAGDLFWLIGTGEPSRGFPAYDGVLTVDERWEVVNFLRAQQAASGPRRLGPKAEIDAAWAVAPDLTIAMGPLAPGSLSDFRGRRLVLLVLYDPSASRDRMTALAKHYGTLSVLGVEVVAVPWRSSPQAVADFGQSPAALFPIVTDGNEDIAAVYGLFVPGATHAEFLIDRQGYIRALWRGGDAHMPDADATQAEVERLNEEKAPPVLPDSHVH